MPKHEGIVTNMINEVIGEPSRVSDRVNHDNNPVAYATRLAGTFRE